MRRARFFMILFAAAFLAGCARCSLSGVPGISSGSGFSGLDGAVGAAPALTIVSYNAHNLFDDVDDGDEYPEFRMDSGGWSAVRYRARLDGLRDAVASLVPEFPDILCLQEIESEKVLADLASGPLAPAGYRHYAAGDSGGGLIRSGLLSRLPLAYVRAHAMQDDPAFGPMRDMLEVGVRVGTAEGAGAADSAGGLVVLFVCHWKSRREGAEETEAARRNQAALLAARVTELMAADPGARIVACGDFNESPDEWERVGRRYRTGLMPARSRAAGSVPVARSPAEAAAGAAAATSGQGGATAGQAIAPALYSPWAGRGGFSYRYRGTPEQLDGFLLSPALCDAKGLDFHDFTVADAPFLFDRDGAPEGWENGRGYSDHLPVGLTLAAAP